MAEVSTRLSRVCCEALVAVDGIEKLVALIRSCNRSNPHMELMR
jgi:abnormal spindle-like microcephaly-associated protein